MIIKVKVHPNSKVERFEKNEEGFEIYVKEPAEDDKANIRVVKSISREFGVDFRKIKIKNPKSRDKIIEIKD